MRRASEESTRARGAPLDPVCNTPRVKRIIGLALVLLAIGLAIALSHAVRERRAFAERWALSVFADLGVGPVRLEVTEVGPEGATVRGLEVGDPVTFSVDQLEFTWRPSEITRFEISELAVTGFHVKASADENGELSFGALDPAFEGEGDGSLAALPRTVTLAGGRVELATPFGGVALHDVAGTLVPDPDRLGTGELRASLRDTTSPERFSPVELAIRAEPSGPAGLDLEVSAGLLGGAVTVSGTGSAIPESGTGELDLALAPVDFGPDAVQLAALAPAFAAQLPVARGSVSGLLQLRSSEHESEPYTLAGDLRIEDLDLERSDARLEGLSGRIQVAGPGAWRTRGLQELHFDLLDLVGAVRDGSVRFEARETDVHLESFRGRWSGGEIVTRGRFDPMNRTGGLAVQLADIDLEQLLETLAIADLEGTGRISGTVPIVFEG